MNNQLTSAEIESIVQSGEGYNAEFKIRVPNKVKELSEEICAFANSAGGILLIGVSDDNVIKGIEIDNGKQSAIQNSLNEINPHLPVEFYSVDVSGRTVWVIEVNTGGQKPYALSGAIYVRQGPNTQKLTSIEQMRDFFQQSNRIYFDEAPCLGFNIESDIDDEFFEEFRINAGLSKSVSREQIINNLQLLLPNGNIKNGGVLFFAQNPEFFIETAKIRCVAFEWANKTQIIDDKIFGGSLMKQYHHAMMWLKGKLNIRYKIEGSGPRKEIWEIPDTAFKEAIINALSHRDYYDKGACITIELFSNRVEISNPGGLTSAIKPDEFGTKSHSRNPLIFGLFERVDMVEKIGSGISRIKDAMKDAELPKPEFKTEGIFTVVFNRIAEESVGEDVAKNTRDKIIESIKDNPTITTKDIASAVGITIKGVEYQLAKMQEDKILIREGSKKSGVWKLLQ
jgi:ATP-dependent DNA helicase RecG